jgi:murein DD-endopeptidase MepM/ murein hydrolase activator NlpD
LAEQNTPSVHQRPVVTTELTRQNERAVASRPGGARPRRRDRLAGTARSPRATARAARSLAALVIVGGLIVTVALPAYGAWQPIEDEVTTLQQVAADDAQSLVVGSDATGAALSRESYSATTQGEIDEKKAQEAAAAAAEAAARASAEVASVPFDYSTVAPGSGAVRWPLGGPFTVTDRFGDRGGAHMGTDMVAAGGTPVFASVDGVVRVSQEEYGGYGVTVTVDSVLNGQQVGTVYPHMQYGSRQVGVGQTVSAGQLIGFVGSTGRSTANHLHFEVYINDTAIDSLAWLQANAG